MKKYVAISVLITLLGMISTGSVLIIFLGSLIIIPAMLVLQILVYFICKAFKAKKKVCKVVSLLPSMLFLLWALFNMSIFVQDSNVFEVAMKTSKPSSVTELCTYEHAWTDYYAEFYCKIAPEDLKAIIKKSKFRKVNESKETFSFTRTKCLKINKVPPWKGFVEYELNSKTNKSGLFDCYLYTNLQHDEMFVRYMAD